MSIDKLPDITHFRQRYNELDALMAEPDFFTDSRRAAEVSREHQKLSVLLEKYERLETIQKQIAESREMSKDDSDPAMQEMAEEEVSQLHQEEAALRENILYDMLPDDGTDSRNTVFEIRAGAGGDEASLFAGDLYRMYSYYAEAQRWRIEAISSHPNECGGFKEVSFLIKGENAFKTLKYESGVHRVQRVPTTETNGRIHTSTATVAVLPEAQEVDVEIDFSDLEISTMRASGAGGQHVNTTDSAVQIHHKPTGMTVYCADERSQLKNKNKAMTVLRSRMLKARQEEEAQKYADHRRNQIGTGDRSERIRTYNFPQSRLTDHRIGFTAHNLNEVMEGQLSDIISALEQADREERVQALCEETAASNEQVSTP
mgnify:CR=1 FL=1